jgi:hypothetical protein
MGLTRVGAGYTLSPIRRLWRLVVLPEQQIENDVAVLTTVACKFP